MTDMRVEKRGFVMRIPEDYFAQEAGFFQKGHTEEIPLTDDDIRAHARAKAAIEELESNPWIGLGRDEDPWLTPLKPRKQFIPEETHEEYMARWRAHREAAGA